MITALALSLNVVPSFAATDWQNPAVMCPEEVLPKGLECPDFSQVDDVYADYPDNMSAAEIKDWKNNKAADLKFCRNSEVLRREKNKAGTYSPATIESAWMTVNGGLNVKEKLNAIQAASVKIGIPPQILLGAMKQESLLSSLGVSPDGGNYSCGMAQLNIQEWCQSIKRLSDEEKAGLDWPSGISCEDDVLPTNIVKPFYDIAIKNIGTRPSYELNSENFKGITLDQVTAGFPAASEAVQVQRFQAVSSFVNHCQDISLSVAFKAQTLNRLYLNFVPKALRDAEQYPAGKTFPRTCANAYPSIAYPLHTGWLMAVAMYNAGPQQSKLVDYYFQIKDDKYPALNPLDLIEALHWGGKWKKDTDFIGFQDQSGNKLQQRWFKSCIVQRHVARVIQHVTLPAESIAKSLEQGGCTLTGVPAYRQKSSGIKDSLVPAKKGLFH